MNTIIHSSLLFLIVLSENNGQFTQIRDCTCEGYEQIYECRVTGRGAFIWKGSAFNCSATNNEIVILVLDSSSSYQCNNRAIVGRLVRVENDNYTSQLTVSVSSGMIGRNISCFHDIGTDISLIGTSLVLATTVPYTPPSGVHLLDVNSSQLTFQWSTVQSNCPSLRYLITSSDCGSCPSVTNNVTALCSLSGVLAERQTQVCEFAIQTVVCTDIVGNLSQKVSVTLRVPEAPVLNVIPVYSYSTRKLSHLITTFTKEVYNSFNSQGLDLSAVSYTVNYTDTGSGLVCVSATIPTSSCVNEVCEHKLKVASSTSPCFSSSTDDDNSITVTVSGVNRLGQGPISVPTSIAGASIGFVDLFFNLSSNSATCLFPKSLEGTRKFCSIEYGLPFREVCQMFAQQNSTSVSDRVTVLFPVSDLQSGYCFTAILSNGTFTAVIEGTINGTTDFGGLSPHTQKIAIITFGSTVGALTLVIVVMTVVLFSILAVLMRSRREIRAEVQPSAIYEDVNAAVRSQSPHPISINTEQNVAYISAIALGHNH